MLGDNLGRLAGLLISRLPSQREQIDRRELILHACAQELDATLALIGLE